MSLDSDRHAIEAALWVECELNLRLGGTFALLSHIDTQQQRRDKRYGSAPLNIRFQNG